MIFTALGSLCCLILNIWLVEILLTCHWSCVNTYVNCIVCGYYLNMNAKNISLPMILPKTLWHDRPLSPWSRPECVPVRLPTLPVFFHGCGGHNTIKLWQWSLTSRIQQPYIGEYVCTPVRVPSTNNIHSSVATWRCICDLPDDFLLHCGTGWVCLADGLSLYLVHRSGTHYLTVCIILALAETALNTNLTCTVSAYWSIQHIRGTTIIMCYINPHFTCLLGIELKRC